MERWEYRHEWVEKMYGKSGLGTDLEPFVMETLNHYGADGWEVCSVLEDWEEDRSAEAKGGGWWLVLLKRRKAAETCQTNKPGDAGYTVRSAG
jgi:hypothetical protein